MLPETARSKSIVLEYEIIWGHIDIVVVVVRSTRSEQVKTLLAGPSPISPMKAKITIFPISNRLQIHAADLRCDEIVKSLCDS